MTSLTNPADEARIREVVREELGGLMLPGLPAGQCSGLRLDDSLLDKYLNPCTAAESQRFARILRRLLRSLDGEIVLTALLGDGEADLLDPEGQEVHRVREFLDGRVAMRSEPSDLRSRGLAILDAFEGDSESGAERHGSTPSTDAGDPRSVGEGVRDGAGISIPVASPGGDS